MVGVPPQYLSTSEIPIPVQCVEKQMEHIPGTAAVEAMLGAMGRARWE